MVSMSVRPSPMSTFDVSDAEVDALSNAARVAIAAVLEKRARSELRVASAFAAVTRELLEVGADLAVLRLAADAVGDEVRHGDLWHVLATKYRGEEAPWPVAAPQSLPEHRDADRGLMATLHVVALTCINETVATTRLESSLWAARGPWMRDTLRSILSDEVGHARIGWAHLASRRVSATTRDAVAVLLPELLRVNLGALFDDIEATLPEAFPEHGILSPADTRTIVGAAMRDLVLPGFVHVGVDVTAARRWCAGEFTNI